MNRYDLITYYGILKDLDCSVIFDNDGSIEFKDFIEQFKSYQYSTGVLNNYYSYRIIINGIKKYANNKFAEIIRSF